MKISKRYGIACKIPDNGCYTFFPCFQIKTRNKRWPNFPTVSQLVREIEKVFLRPFHAEIQNPKWKTWMDE